jgi:hypothetical protein
LRFAGLIPEVMKPFTNRYSALWIGHRIVVRSQDFGALGVFTSRDVTAHQVDSFR